MFIHDPDLDFSTIPDPESKGQKGTGSRIRNTAVFNGLLSSRIYFRLSFLPTYMAGEERNIQVVSPCGITQAAAGARGGFLRQGRHQRLFQWGFRQGLHLSSSGWETLLPAA